MRYTYLAGFVVFLFCCKAQDYYNAQVNFQQKPFAELLNQAQSGQTKILVDFWADG